MSRKLVFWAVFLVIFGLLMLGGINALRYDSDLMRWTLPWVIANRVLPVNDGQLQTLIATSLPTVLFCAAVGFAASFLVPSSSLTTKVAPLWAPKTLARVRPRTVVLVVAVISCGLLLTLVALAWPRPTYLQCRGQVSSTSVVLRGPDAGVDSRNIGASWAQSRVEGLGRGNDLEFSEIASGGDSVLAAALVVCDLARLGQPGYQCGITVSRSHLSIMTRDRVQAFDVELSRLSGDYEAESRSGGEGVYFSLTERGACRFDTRFF
jgi:hypothetical protein